MDRKMRRINTRMYGQRAFVVLDALHGQLSDGIWENSRGYDKYWTNFDVKRAEDDRVYFEVSSEPTRWYGSKTLENPFASMDGASFLKWVAGKLKAAIRTEAKDARWPDKWWTRTSSLRSGYLGSDLDVTVADVYEIYDELLGRRSRTADNGERVFGQAADPGTVRARKEKVRKLKELQEAFRARFAEIERRFEEAQKRRDADRKAAWEDYYAKSKAIDPASPVLP